MEDISKIFRLALSMHLRNGPWGIKSQLARAAGVLPQEINDILSAKVYGSEDKRRALAAALGYAGRAYEDFLDIGRQLLQGQGASFRRLSPLALEVQARLRVLDEPALAAVKSLLERLGPPEPPEPTEAAEAPLVLRVKPGPVAISKRDKRPQPGRGRALDHMADKEFSTIPD